jgi:hypothetical protein
MLTNQLLNKMFHQTGHCVSDDVLKWEFGFKNCDLKTLNENAIFGDVLVETGALTLVTKSGFEAKHVGTSLIASW